MNVILESAVMESITLSLKDGKICANLMFSGRPTNESVHLLGLNGAVNETIRSASMAIQSGEHLVSYSPDRLEQYSFTLPAAAIEACRFVVDTDSDGVYITMYIKVRFDQGIEGLVEKFLRSASACGTLEVSPAQEEMFPLEVDSSQE